MKRFFQFCLLALTLLAGGCFDYQETVTVDKDGKVTVEVLANILAQAMPFLKNRPEYPLLVGAAAGKKALQTMIPEAKILRAKSVKLDGWVTSDLAFRFDSIDALSGSSGKLGGQEIKWYENPDGSMTFERTIYKPDMKTIPGDIGTKIADRYWKDAKMHFEMTTPLKVRSSNGFKRGDYTVVWDANLAMVKKLGLRLNVVYEPAPLLPRNMVLLIGAAVLLLLLLGGIVWKFRGGDD